MHMLRNVERKFRQLVFLDEMNEIPVAEFNLVHEVEFLNDAGICC